MPLSSKSEVMNVFKSQLDKFIDNILELMKDNKSHPTYGDFALIKVNLGNILSYEDVLLIFIWNIRQENSLREKKLINKDDSYFLYHDEKRDKYPDTMSRLRGIWRDDSILSDENRETIWKFMHVFVKLANKYEIIVDENNSPM